MLYWSVLRTPGQQPADSSELAAYMSDQSLFRRQQVTDWADDKCNSAYMYWYAACHQLVLHPEARRHSRLLTSRVGHQ
jgi:hypothetical protein